MRKLSLFISILIVVSIFSMPAVAGPNGGATATEEGKCDDFKAHGVTKGLYGLCVAYCEAGAKGNGVLRNFENKWRKGDPALPCSDDPVCPCLINKPVEEIGVDLIASDCAITDVESRVVYIGIDPFAFESLVVDDSYCLYIDRSGAIVEIVDPEMSVKEEAQCRMDVEFLAKQNFPGCAPLP